MPATIAAIAARLGSAARRFDIDILARCDSTNAELLKRAEAGAPSGTVVIAEEQTAGRGRRGRRWFSSPGDSLSFSLLWRFPPGTPPAGLSLAAGVAVARALETASTPAPGARRRKAGLKWPNDILLDRHKLGGILVELLPGSPHAAVIGIGINLRLPATLPEDVRATSAALSAGDEPADQDALYAALLAALLETLERFGSGGFAAIREQWMACHAFQDAPVRLSSDFGPALEGICRGVDGDGALLLDIDGRIERILSGEVSLRPARRERMILCLDAGNSRLKCGLHDGAGWRMQGALDYGAFDDLVAELPAAPTRVVACNVAGDAVRQRIEALADRLACPLDWLAAAASACGVSNGYDSPAQLGADRWAALIGARSLHPGPAVVVMAGTATTVDALDGDGRFRGGLILPGLALMRAALAQNTAGLPHAAGRYQSIPTNTDDAIASGAIHATLGAIARMRATVGADAACLLSGGAAAELAPHLAAPLVRIDNLVLEGLATWAGPAA